MQKIITIFLVGSLNFACCQASSIGGSWGGETPTQLPDHSRENADLNQPFDVDKNLQQRGLEETLQQKELDRTLQQRNVDQLIQRKGDHGSHSPG